MWLVWTYHLTVCFIFLNLSLVSFSFCAFFWMSLLLVWFISSYSTNYKSGFLNVFIYFFFNLSWVFVATCGLSLIVASGGYSLAVCRLLIAVASLVVDCRLYRYELQMLWYAGSEVVAHRHVESFHVPCIGRCILIHCTTREVQYNSFFFFLL